MIKCKQFKQSNAFTLIELLVAVAILVLVLGAAVSVEVSNLKLASRDEHYLQATNLAQEQLNLIKTVRDNNPATDPFKDFIINQTLKLIIPGNQLKTLTPLDTANGDTAALGHKVKIGDKDYFVKIQVIDAANLP